MIIYKNTPLVTDMVNNIGISSSIPYNNDLIIDSDIILLIDAEFDNDLISFVSLNQENIHSVFIMSNEFIKPKVDFLDNTKITWFNNHQLQIIEKQIYDLYYSLFEF